MSGPLVLAATTQGSIALITLGVAASAVYVVFPKLRPLLTPLADLLVALRPLAIPILVLAAAATVNFSAIVQAVAAVVLVLSVYFLFVAPELDEKRELLAWKRITVIALIAALVLVGIFELASIDSILSGQAGPAGAFLVVALVTLALAALARLVSFAIGPPARMYARWLVVLLLLVATGQALAWAGIVADDPGAGAIAVRLFAGAGGAIVLAVAVEAVVGRRDATSESRATFAALGLSLALISGFLVMCATTASLLQLTTSGGDSVSTRDRGAAPAPLYADDNRSAEYVHAPVLAFNEQQPWTPISVNEYFTDYNAHVERKDKSRVKSADGTYKCPALGPGKCLRVAIDCKSASDCFKRVPAQHHERGEHVSSGQIYVRVLTRKPPKDDDPGDAVARRGLFEPFLERSLPKGGPEGIAHKTQVLLQYWFFYPYDEWTTRVLGATFTQRHEGDWESVSVGLGAGDKPLFVAYSAHCGGSWKPWADTVRYGTHPLVAVALGSHGNYSNAGAQRPPDFTSCIKVQRGIGTLVALAANIRDVTADRWEWGADRVEKVNENQWPMNFPGTWGDNDVVQLKTRRSFPEDPVPGAGPASPPLQPLWQDPIRTIFCDRYWDHPSGQNCKEALRPGAVPQLSARAPQRPA